MSPFDAFFSDMATASPSPTAEAGATVAGLCLGDFHDRWEVSRRISDLGEAALDDLLAVLADDRQDWEARWFAARALGGLDHPAVIPALIQTFVATIDDDLRQAVANALSQIGPPAIAALGEQIAHPARRPGAVQALARIYHPATIPPLLEAIHDDRAPVRATAIAALSAYDDPALLSVMEQGLQDSSEAVRLAAIRGLLSLRRAAPLPCDRLMAALTPLLSDSHPRVAQQAVQALGRLTSPTAAAPLLQLISEPQRPEALKIAALQALLWQGTATALDGLITAWDDLQPPLRLALVKGLSTLSPDLSPRFIPALLGWLSALPANTDHSSLRCHLVLALGQIGTVAQVPALTILLHDPDPGVQLHAAAALRLLDT